MIHLKKIIAFLLAAVLCIALAACGSSDDGDDERSTTDTTERAPKESTAELDDETSDTEDTDGAAADVGEYVGLWSYVGENLWLRIYDDSTWEFLDENSAVLADGTLWAEEDGVTLHFGENGDVLMLDRTVSGDLIDSANGGTLVSAEEIVSNEPCFARAGIGLNAETDDGYYLLKDGVCTYYGLGEDYSTADCYWEVAKQREDVHDGIRELQFDAVCYIPESSIPQGDYIAYTKSELYDYYNLRRQSQSFYKERFGLDIPLEKFNCEGGRSQNVFELCKECPFVKCCKERSVDSCSKCPGYPCKEISDYQVKYVNKCNQI